MLASPQTWTTHASLAGRREFTAEELRLRGVPWKSGASAPRRVSKSVRAQPQWSHVVSTRVVRQPLDFPSVNLCVPPVFKHFAGSISRRRHFETAAAKVSLLYDFRAAPTESMPAPPL